MWPTIRSTCRLMPPIALLRPCTVWSPRARRRRSRSAICATRCALSAICREVASSSLIVVVISSSPSPALGARACWLAAACSSADELCTCWTAAPIWLASERVMTNPAPVTSRRQSSVPSRMVARAFAAARRPPRPRAVSRSRSSWSIRPEAPQVVHRRLSLVCRADLGRGGFEALRFAQLDGSLELRRASWRRAARARRVALLARVVGEQARAVPRPSLGAATPPLRTARGNASSPVMTKPRCPVSASLSRLRTFVRCSSTTCA